MGNPNNVSVRNLAQLWENVSKAEGGGGGIALDGAADRNNTGCACDSKCSNFNMFWINRSEDSIKTLSI